MSADSGWTPVLRGGVYCSPRCGGGCTKAAYDKACADADALVSRLGAGWRSRVWENLGWHSSAEKGCASVHADKFRGNVTYTVFFNTPAKQFVESAETPEDAVGIAVQMARSAAIQINAACDALLAEGEAP